MKNGPLPITDALLPSETTMSQVTLTVHAVEPMMAFYRDVIGLPELETGGAPADNRPPVERNARRILGNATARVGLIENPAASPGRTFAGLFHTAFLYPSRAALSYRLRALLEKHIELEGFADHGVSEAVYLRDPEGNGVEMYVDRPREVWPTDHEGRLAMITAPLDVESLLAVSGTTAEPVSAPPVIGHVHLSVSDVERSDSFYVHTAGFGLMQHFGPSAGFVSVGGYHHHLAYNIWMRATTREPGKEITGLARLSVGIPGTNAYRQLQSRLKSAGVPFTVTDEGMQLADPSGIPLSFTPVGSPAGDLQP